MEQHGKGGTLDSPSDSEIREIPPPRTMRKWGESQFFEVHSQYQIFDEYPTYPIYPTC